MWFNTQTFITFFADDTNLLYSSIFLKDINKKVNFELKNIVHSIIG